MADVPLFVVSDNSSSERRITPSWTISQLRGKLERITGVPPSSQRLSLKAPTDEAVIIQAADEDATHLTEFRLTPYAQLQVGTSHSLFPIPSLCPFLSFTFLGGEVLRFVFKDLEYFIFVYYIYRNPSGLGSGGGLKLSHRKNEAVRGQRGQQRNIEAAERHRTWRETVGAGRPH